MGYVLVTGGNMVNKGAQAMVFVAVSEIKRHYPECKIVVVSDVDAARSDEELSQYRFLFRDGTCLYGSAYKLIQRRYGKLDRHGDAARIRKNIDRVVDVSGYTFGSVWGFWPNMLAAYRVRAARKLWKPIYFMPQSFGPFEWKGLRRIVSEHFMKKWFCGTEIFFCREQEGYELALKKGYPNRAHYAVDLVLANKGVDFEELFYERPHKEEYDRVIAGVKPHSVGVLPNVRNDGHSSAQGMDLLYRTMIDRLLELGRTVYLIRHSDQDLECCRRIREYYRGEERVVLLEEDLDCFAYSELAAKFDYLIASRYHAVVHAYKKGTPCIVPGWADKYHELLTLLGQEAYSMDVRTAQPKDAMELIGRMEADYEKESEEIKKRLPELQKENVFDSLDPQKNCWEGITGLDFLREHEIAGQCVSCGICAAVCPAGCLHFERQRGYYFPVVDHEACVGCKKCERVCYAKAKMTDIPFRKPQRALTAQAKDEEILSRATSGGAVTALVERLLRDKVYDNAYLVEGYKDDGQFFTREFTAGDDLSMTQKSRYAPVSQQHAVEGILAHPEKRSIYVGVPCAVYGLLEALKLSGRDRDQVLIIGLFCDRMQTYNFYDYFRKRYLRDEPEKGRMTELYFRDKRAGGWPGNMRLVFPDGSVTVLNAKERMFVKDFFSGRHCAECTDKLNRQADIAFGDNYTGKNSDKRGSNSVLVYTDRGAAAWDHCEEVFVTFPSSAEEICKSQNTTWETAFCCTRDGLEKVEPEKVDESEVVGAMADAAHGEWMLYDEIDRKIKRKKKELYCEALRRKLREKLHL